MKYKLISSIVSLTLCTILFICICFAWYTQNTQVEVDGITGNTTEDSCDIQINLYQLNQQNADGTYVKSDTKVSDREPSATIESIDKTIMRHYGALDNSETSAIDESITGILIEIIITIKENSEDTYALNACTPTDRLLMVDTTSVGQETADLAKYQQNKLSNVIELKEATVTNNTVSLVNNPSASFVAENRLKNTSIPLKENIQQSTSFYYVMDYADVQVNYLYEQMITIFGAYANLSTPILFQEDISFELYKGGAQNEV